MKCLKFTSERGNDWSGNRPLCSSYIQVSSKAQFYDILVFSQNEFGTATKTSQSKYIITRLRKRPLNTD